MIISLQLEKCDCILTMLRNNPEQFEFRFNLNNFLELYYFDLIYDQKLFFFTLGYTSILVFFSQIYPKTKLFFFNTKKLCLLFLISLISF